MCKIFVTGATGFIGKNLIKNAIQDNFQIVAIRRNKNNNLDFGDSNKIKWIDSDLKNIREEMFSDSEILIHLASAGVSPKKVEHENMLMSNVIDTSKLIERAVKAGIKRVIMVGSCHEYGKVSYGNGLIKADSKLDPVTFYASSKAASYFISLAQCRKYMFEMFYGRIFSVYGDGQFSGNFWPSLKKAAVNGKNFHMTSGEQIRDFIHVDKVSKELLQASRRNDLIPGKVMVKNIATGNPMRLIDFAKKEWKKFGAKGNLLPGSIQSRLNEADFLSPDLQEKIL